HVVARAEDERPIGALDELELRRDLARDTRRAAGLPAELDDVDAFLELRRAEYEPALRVERERAAVEHELVLAADHVEIHDRQPGLPRPRREHALARAVLLDVKRRAVDHEQGFR